MIYLDAFLPENGKAIIDSYPSDRRAGMEVHRRDNTQVPPLPLAFFGVTEQPLIDFITPRLLPNRGERFVKGSKGLPEAGKFPQVRRRRRQGVRMKFKLYRAEDCLAGCIDKCRLANRRRNSERVVISTLDKDLAQCVQGARVVQLDRRMRIERDEQGVIQKFGVKPSSIPDYLALVGDTADGYPGWPG